MNSHTMRMIYNDYIKDKIKGDPYYIEFVEFMSICKDYFDAYMNRIIFHSDIVKIPHRMGNLSVRKKIPKVLSSATLSVDWELSKQYHKVIHHSNDHSGGFKFRFIWSKKQAFIVNKNLYRLVLSRNNKRLLAKAIKSREFDYLEQE